VTNALRKVSSTNTTSFTPANITGSTNVPCTVNLALAATASASSVSDGSSASNAIDGDISGYPDDESAEWVANGIATASLTLTWRAAQTFDTVVLYDRPNSDDQITQGTIRLADGTTFSTNGLRNDGSATVIQLGRPYTSRTLRFTYSTVSWTTQNAGLSEIQVYLAGTAACPSSSAASASASATSIPSGTNIAPLATAFASTESPDQQASKAIDGVFDGYPGDYTKEWASNGQQSGATLNLTWSQGYLVNAITVRIPSDSCLLAHSKAAVRPAESERPYYSWNHHVQRRIERIRGLVVQQRSRDLCFALASGHHLAPLHRYSDQRFDLQRRSGRNYGLRNSSVSTIAL
jgi:hypothetical protein